MKKSLVAEKFLTQRDFYLTKTRRRRISGPKTWNLPQPEHGSQIFVGKIPYDIFEDVLIPLFEEIAPIFQFCLMLSRNDAHRGYAFVTYANPREADRAVEYLHLNEVCPNRYISVFRSIDNCCLYIGKLPVMKTMKELEMKIRELLEDDVKIVMLPAYNSKDVNRGYAFAEFSDHLKTRRAKWILSKNNSILWGSKVVVDWAEPIPYVPQDIIDKVVTIFIRNLPVNIDKAIIKSALDNVLPNGCAILDIRSRKDFAFVDFDTHDNAEKALTFLQNFHFLEKDIETTWARPMEYKKFVRCKRYPLNFCRSVPFYMRKFVFHFKAMQRCCDEYVSSRISEKAEPQKCLV